MYKISSISAIAPLKGNNACSGCGLIAWCRPAHLNPREGAQIESVTEHRHTLKRDRVLFHSGDALASLYIVNSGSLKTTIADNDGRVQVTGFSLPGDMVGIEAIGSGRHPCDVIAMEDSSCCGAGYADLSRLSQSMPALQIHLHRMMSREITRNYGLMFLLGSMGAEERVAQFILNLSARYAARGYSASQFRLCMTRIDIGSYLGLRLETVSRVMTLLSNRNILEFAGRDINVRSLGGLQQIIGRFELRAARAATRH